MARMGENRISGLQKAAILLISLGPERSAGIFKHLKEEEIEELTLEIANTRSVTPQIKEEIINEFYEICLAQQYIAEGGIAYAKELLEKALQEHHVEDEVVLYGSFCIGKCNRVGVTVQVNDDVHVGVTRENFRDFFKKNILDVIERERS